MFLVFALACGAADESAAPVPSPTAEAPPTASAAAPPATGSCARIREQAADLIGSEQQACATDDDCGCAPAIIDCGGVFDRHTASALQALKTRWSAGHCDYRHIDGDGFNCGPWECTAECAAGRCAQGSH